MSKTVRVVAALIARPGTSEYLVQQRLPDKSRALLWEFPGGKVEPGETDEAALARECTEELGVELQVGERLWETTHQYSDLTVELLLFRAEIVRGCPKPLGANELRFLSAEKMRALPFCEADLPLLDALARGAVR